MLFSSSLFGHCTGNMIWGRYGAVEADPTQVHSPWDNTYVSGITTTVYIGTGTSMPTLALGTRYEVPRQVLPRCMVAPHTWL